MAMEPAFFDLLDVNDGYFPAFIEQHESENEILRALLDAEYAEELQFQETLKASLISCQMPSDVSSSNPASKTNMEEAILGHKIESSLKAPERGESSLSCCYICLERKENSQIIQDRESSGQICCLGCRKTIEMSKKGSFSKELSMAMSSRNDTGKSLSLTADANNNNSAPKTETAPVSSGEAKIISLNSALDEVELKFRESKHGKIAETIAAEQQVSNTKAWGHKDVGHNSPIPSNGDPEMPVGVIGSTPGNGTRAGQERVANDFQNNVAAIVDDSDDSDAFDDSDEFDSDPSEKSPENTNKSRLFQELLEILEKMAPEDVNEPTRQWHCPACQGGPGATKWYQGLRAMISHAKTRGGKKMKLHRELAQLLEEKLSRKGNSGIRSVDLLSKWKGLKDEKKNDEIVWPPMVIIRNTALTKDENNKWIGMTSIELLESFSSYHAIMKVQHAYNWHGHRGISALIFESSARGFLEAELLHKHFEEQGTGRYAWDHRPVYFLPSGERQLYGFMATKEDVDYFNQFSRGKPKLKCEMRTYQEMVLNQIKETTEDRHQAFEESNGITGDRLEKAMKEIEVLRNKIKLLHEQNMEEMNFQEQFYKEQIKIILEDSDNKGGELDEIPKDEEEENENVHGSSESPANTQDDKHRVQETDKSKDNEEKLEEVAGKGKQVEGQGGQDECNKEEEEVNLGNLYVKLMENSLESVGTSNACDSVTEERRRLRSIQAKRLRLQAAVMRLNR